MENKPPIRSQGYQKQIKKETRPQPQPKSSALTDYSSPLAKKWPAFVQAIERGDIEPLQQLIDEGLNVNLLRDNATPLMLAASKGQTGPAVALLQAGANINAKNDDGWTALHKAAGDQTEVGIVELLLQSGVDAEAKNRSGKTALQVAEEKGSRDIARVIKQHVAKLRAEALEWDGFLDSPEGRPWKEIKRLESLTALSRFWWLPSLLFGGLGLGAGFFFNAVVLSGVIGFAIGLLIGCSVFLFVWKSNRYLDSIGPVPELDIHMLRAKRKAGVPLMEEWKQEEPPAEENPEIEVVPEDRTIELVPEQEVGPGPRKASGPKLNKKIILSVVLSLLFIFLIGVLVGSKDSLVRWYFAKKLESKGGQFSEQAFLAEVAKNNEESVDLFIKAGIHAGAKNENGQTALLIASENGSVNILKKLAKLNPVLLNEADKKGNTALMTAVRRGHENSVAALVESGADVNYLVPSNEGAATALQAAVDSPDFKEEHTRIVQYLLQHGANVKGRNKAGQSPLLFAADHGRTDAAKALIAYGADVHDADLNGRFPLLSAACKGYSWFVSLLLDKGANVNMALPDGQTALMCAAREGYGDTVNTLLERGAKINAMSSANATALTEAAAKQNREIVQQLLAHGADPGKRQVPEELLSLQGKQISIKVKKNTLSSLLARIARTAILDGYTVRVVPGKEQKLSVTIKGPWNKVLAELAIKNHFMLLMKEKEIFALPYDPAGIKR